MKVRLGKKNQYSKPYFSITRQALHPIEVDYLQITLTC